MKNIIVLLCIALVFFTSCKKKDTDFIPINLPPDIAGPVIKIDSFPLQIGNRWIYSVQQQEYNSKGLLSNRVYLDTLIAVKDTNVNSYRLIKMVERVNNRTDSFYYINLANGLHRLYFLHNIDSLSIPDSSEYIARLPITLDSAWYSHEQIVLPLYYNNPIQRKWTNYVKVATDAGVFDCIELKVYFNTILAYQYYSSKGLSQKITTYETGSVIMGQGPTTVKEICTLISVNF